jgi:hypothetical protein
MTDNSQWASQYRSTQQKLREHNSRLVKEKAREDNITYAQNSNTEPPHAISAFEDFAIEKLQSLLQCDSSPREVSNAIAATFCHEKKPEDSWYTFTCAYLSAAEYTSDERLSQRLAQLLLELCLRPQARNELGEDMEMHRNIPFGNPPKIKPGELIVGATGLRYFTDAPWISMVVGEVWNGKMIQKWPSTSRKFDSLPDAATVSPYAKDLDAVRVRFSNLNVFLAYLALVGASVDDSPCGTWPETFGLEAIANALETADQESSDADVRIAAKWFQICGKAIYDNSNWGLGDEVTPSGSEGELWKARKRDDDSADVRWNFWLLRASDLAVSTNTNKGVPEAATDCMRQISNASKTG